MLCIAAIASIGSALQAAAQLPELAQSPSYKVSGQISWLLRYGGGDGQGLSQKGYSRGLFFSQALSLDADISVRVERPMAGILSLRALLDNQQPDFLQSLEMRWQARSWQIEFGDFPMGRPGSLLASPSRLLKGFRAEWQLSDRLTLGGIYSQVSGILQSRTFRGNSVEQTITFAFRRPDRPLLEEPYLRNLRGLDYFPLGKSYVEGFTPVSLAFKADSRLEEILRDYDLGSLFKTIADDPELDLDPSAYTVIFTGEEYFLALTREFLALVRERLLKYIDDYNLAYGRSGEDRKEYPFSEGTEYELGFLRRLSEIVALKVGSLSFRAQDAARQRFYALGHQDIQAESLKIEIKLEEDFKDIRDPALGDYRYKIYADVGIIELDFPADFFKNPQSGVRVTYSYQSGSGTYVLGLSILKGSEKVYLNGQLLQSGVDYLIEYETGFLILLREIKSDDVLRVDYELARGALGVGGDYGQSFQGLTLSYAPLTNLKLNFDLLQSFETPRPGAAPETLPTMPNTHTVLGISGRLENETLQSQFEAGFTINRFPPDDNLKENLPNRINAIYAFEHGGRALLLFGHRNGLLVYDGRDWSSYGLAEGLSGLTIYDIAQAPEQLVLATSGGISLVRIQPGDPSSSFARRANWKSLSEQDGLPSSTVYALLIEGGQLWAGTEKGLAQAPLTDLTRWKVFDRRTHPEMLSERVFELAASRGRIYVGTDKGLMIFDPQTERFQMVEDLRGLPIRALAIDGPLVYAATDRGVRALEDGLLLGWIVSNTPVKAMAVMGGEFWYSTPQGLYGLKKGLIAETRGRVITALGGSGEALWAGEEATEEYELILFEVRSDLEGARRHLQAETLLDGRARDRYRDIPAFEHTDYGWIGRWLMSKQLGPLKLEGSLEGSSPRYTPIGTLSRQDQLRLGLSALYPLSEALSVRARHEEGLSDLFRAPSLTLQDGIGLQFSSASGPQLSLEYTIRHIDQDLKRPGYDRQEWAYTLSALQRFLDSRLTLRLSYELSQTEAPRQPLYSSWLSNLNGQATFHALPGLTLRLNYRLPIQWRFGQTLGDHRLDWGAQYSTGLVLAQLPLSVDASYGGRSQLSLAGLGNALDQDASVLFRVAAVQLGGLTLLPQASFSLRSGDLFGPNASFQWSGEGTLEGRLLDLSGRLTYRRAQFSYPRSQLARLQDSLRISLDYQGFSSLRPTLELFGTLETLAHPLFGRKTRGQYDIALRVVWQALGPLQAELQLSHRREENDRARTASYLLQQSLQYALLPGLAPRLDFQVEYVLGQEGGEAVERLSGELTLASELKLMEEWSATLSGAYLFGLDAIRPSGSYHSFALTLQVGRPFALF